MSELPKDWIGLTLGDIGKWSSGGTPSRRMPSYYGSDIPWVKTGDLRDAVLYGAPEAITNEGLANSSAKVFPVGTLLIAMYGATIGRTAVLGVPASTNQACAALIAEGNTTELIPYVWWFLRSKTNDLKVLGQGGAQPNISQEILKALPISIPPLAEQRRIVEKLDALTSRTARARADLDRIPALATRYKQAVLAKAFSGELTADWRKEHDQTVFTSSEIEQLLRQRDAYQGERRGSRLREAPQLKLPGQSPFLPRTWGSGCLADLTSLRVGYAFKSSWYKESGVPLIRGANVGVGALDGSDLKFLSPEDADQFDAYRLEEGAILLAMDRPLISTGLKIARITTEEVGALLVQRVASPLPTALIEPDFLWWLLHSHHYVDQIEKHATGSDLPHVSGNDILTTFAPLPPVAEQREIARLIYRLFADIDRMVTEAAAARRLLDRLDQAVLAKAFRGELVPQDPSDEPASVLLDRIRAERAAAPKAKRGRGKAAA